MAKVVQFVPSPEKFGFKPVRKKKLSGQKPPGQLNLFSGGKVVSLNQLSTFEQALSCDERGDYSSARDYYLRAIAEKDCLADAYCNLGILESGAGHYTKAIDCFTLSLKEDPRHFEAHYNLANVYAEVGNFPLAKVHYQLAVQIEPDFSNGYFNLALALAMNKEIPQAIEALLAYRKMAGPEEQRQAEELISALTRTLG